MKPWLVVFVACLACGGDDLSKKIDKVTDKTAELGSQTDAVCYVADHLGDSKAQAAISEHAFRILEKPQTNKVALRAQIDCIAKGVSTSRSYPMGFTDNLVRAYAKHPSDAVKQALGMVADETLRKQVGEYLYELAVRADDAGEAAEVTPGVLEVLDRLKMTAYISGSLWLLYARTGHPALAARLDTAPSDKVAAIWFEIAELIESGPEGDRKKLVEKLLADFAARNIELDRAHVCRLASGVKGCDEVLEAQARADAKLAADASPLLAILEPVKIAAAKAGQPSGVETFQAEQDGTAPSPVHAPAVEVPEMAAAVEQVAALGKPIEEDCRAMMRYGGPGALVCARALGTIKLDLLTGATLAALAEYNAAYAREGRKAHKDGHAVVAGLRALMGHAGKEADDAFMQSLSAYDPELAKYVMDRVKERATMEQVVGGLFQFMARKDKFALTEIDNYVGLLTSYGAPVTAPIVTNLERELAKAKRPEKVFWAHKVVALFALEQAGSAAATSILDKYAADTSGYLDLTTAGESGTTMRSREVPFVDVVARTKQAIAAR